MDEKQRITDVRGPGPPSLLIVPPVKSERLTQSVTSSSSISVPSMSQMRTVLHTGRMRKLCPGVFSLTKRDSYACRSLRRVLYRGWEGRWGRAGN